MQKSEFSITQGMSFGDLALGGSQSGMMRSATIVANSDAHFAVLKRQDYDVYG
jgi:CRP-like cAMP-binding protein